MEERERIDGASIHCAHPLQLREGFGVAFQFPLPHQQLGHLAEDRGQAFTANVIEDPPDRQEGFEHFLIIGRGRGYVTTNPRGTDCTRWPR